MKSVYRTMHTAYHIKRKKYIFVIINIGSYTERKVQKRWEWSDYSSANCWHWLCSYALWRC